MAEDNGDYLSRFERMEKTLEGILEVQKIEGDNLNKIVAMLQVQAEHEKALDGRVDQLGNKVDDLVGAIRQLIDRIPPESLRR